MSDNVNTELLERVAERIDNLRAEGTDFEYQVEQSIKNNDLENLRWLLHTYCDICGQETTANCNNANCDV